MVIPDVEENGMTDVAPSPHFDKKDRKNTRSGSQASSFVIYYNL